VQGCDGERDAGYYRSRGADPRLGITYETFLGPFWAGVASLAFADGPTDAHRSQIARTILKTAKPVEGLFPSDHNPTRLAAALARYPDAAS
jgi:acyl-CoA dehydrogenase